MTDCVCDKMKRQTKKMTISYALNSEQDNDFLVYLRMDCLDKIPYPRLALFASCKNSEAKMN